MPRAYGLGPLPGTDLIEACDIIVSETGDMPHLPILPERGLGHDQVAVTAAMIAHLTIDRGPRGWVLTDRPRLATHDARDHFDRDLDVAEALWTKVERVKIQALGPFSLATAVELANGHRALTDRGALRDLTQALIDGLSQRTEDIRRRFAVDEVVIQLDEPWLAAIAAGRVPGTTDFDTIKAINPVDLNDQLGVVVDALGTEVLLNQIAYPPLWDVAPCQLLIDTAKITGTAQLDGLGAALAEGRVGLGVSPEQVAADPRAVGIRLARLSEELGVDPAGLAGMDVHPGAGVDKPAATYAGLSELAGILERDAGDL